jgi:hypothetical protein
LVPHFLHLFLHSLLLLVHAPPAILELSKRLSTLFLQLFVHTLILIQLCTLVIDDNLHVKHFSGIFLFSGVYDFPDLSESRLVLIY